MRTEARLHKIRIVQSGGGTVCWAVAIPATFSDWFGINVSIRESGNCLILTSGALPDCAKLRDIKNEFQILSRFRL